MLHWALLQPISYCPSTRACALSGAHTKEWSFGIHVSKFTWKCHCSQNICINLHSSQPPPCSTSLTTFGPIWSEIFCQSSECDIFHCVFVCSSMITNKVKCFFLWAIINYFCFLFCKSAGSCLLLIYLLSYLFFQSNWFIGIL